jgi:hypothetical protein
MNQPSRAAVTFAVTEEQIEVHHEVVDSGRPLRLRKEVDEVIFPLREALAIMAVHVERIPIGRVVEALPEIRQEGDVTVVPVIEERLVTRKELVLVEEIRLTQQREVMHMKSDIPLKRERVIVERFNPESGQWLPEPGDPDARSETQPPKE